jgi:hypothetical protein
MDTVNLIKHYKQEDHNKDPKAVNRAKVSRALFTLRHLHYEELHVDLRYRENTKNIVV